MSWSSEVVLLSVLLLLPASASAYNILALAVDMTSHIMVVGNLGRHLVSRGHDVTLVISTSMETPSFLQKTGIKILKFHNTEEPYCRNEDLLRTASDFAFDPSLTTAMPMDEVYEKVETKLANSLIADKKFYETLLSANYDFILVDWVTAYLLVPYILQKPFATIEPECQPIPHRVPSLPSFVPSIFSIGGLPDDMTFMERLQSLFYFLSFGVMMGQPVRVPIGYRSDWPSLEGVTYDDLTANATLCISTRHNALDYVRPMMPNIVSMTTMISRPANTLPNDLLTYMNASSDGVILFSFGSWVSELPEPLLAKLLNAFSKVPQRVLFKYGGQLDNVPENVLVRSWFPQNDILAHPNMKLFITHGGYTSFVESIYHAVPVIVFPYALDQHANAKVAVSKKIGLSMMIGDFTEAELVSNINAVIAAPSYKQQAAHLSAIYRHVEDSGTTNPIFWIEHVIKHGGKHLKSHAHQMPWYEYAMLDIVLFFITIAVLVIMTITILCCCLLKICRKRKTKVD